MARSQARILVSIWSDDDFTDLDPGPQRLYLFLLSQPNLNHAGLLPLTVKRWARSSKAITMDTVEADLDGLEAAGYVVVDRDTEEVLIRTLVKNDGVWKQPKVMPAMAADAGEIVSPNLRYHLGQELRRIDLTPLKPETRAIIEPVMAGVLDTLPDTPPDTVPDRVFRLANVPVADDENTVPDTHPDTSTRVRVTRDTRAASASTSTTTSTPSPLAPATPPRERDEVWDALIEACNIDAEAITADARGAYNRAAKQLRNVGATAGEIRRRAAVYRGQWRDASLTPTALARRWSECDRPPPAGGPPPSRNRQILDAAMERATAGEQAPGRRAIQ